MGVVFAVFATVAFAWTIFHGLLSFLRWLREPTFEVLDASFTTEKREGLSIVKEGHITVVAFGGARTRQIVNWQFMLFRQKEGGGRVGLGDLPFVSPMLETIPAHEATRLALSVEPGMVLDEVPETLTGELYFRLGKYGYGDKVEFTLRRVSTGGFSLKRPIAEYFYGMRAPWRKRAVRWLQRRF